MDKHGNNITENLTDQNDPERSEKQVKLKITQRPMFRRGLFIFLVLASVFTFAIAVFRIGDIFAVLDSIFGYIMPVFYGIAIAYLLNPVVNFFQLRFEPFLKKRCRSETRAKKLLIVIGSEKVIDYMIQNVDSKKRNTGLEFKMKLE